MANPLFRFAPSPNGYLHLGHAYSVLFTHHWAQKLNGQMLLRIEDIDQSRTRPEFIESLYADLNWLGIPIIHPVRIQSQHFASYQQATATLQSQGLLYPCFCTRKITSTPNATRDPDGTPLYAGTCKHLSAAEIKTLHQQNTPYKLRLNMQKAIADAGTLHITEALPTPASPTTQRIAQPQIWGDIVLVRKDTPTSYHLSVVVDDASQNITHITRGMDLYHATDIHVLLQKLLNLPAPIYTHHPLILDEVHDKLSKSRHSQSLRELRELGWTAQKIKSDLGFL